METIKLNIPAVKKLSRTVQIQNGVVSSGDMEVLFESDDSDVLSVLIKTSVDNSGSRWAALFDRIADFNEIPSGAMRINDFGASPGVARLRIEQTLDEVMHA